MTYKMNNFLKNGFSIVDVLAKEEHQMISKTIKRLLNQRLSVLTNDGIHLNNLKDYHNLPLTEDIHNKVVGSSFRRIDFKDFYACIKNNSSINKIMNESWGHNEFRLFFIGNLKEFDTKENYSSFRLARPNISRDVGGIHVDKHAGGIKNIADKNLLIIWIPIVGFSQEYTLNFAPGSHKYDHPESSIEEDNRYISMTYDDNYTDKFKYHRPKLNLGQGIIFDPNLLHGKSYNLGLDTRVSIELRLFNAKKNFSFYN